MQPLSLDVGIECVLSGVAEWSVADVMTQANRLREILVEAKVSGHGATDLCHLECVGHPGHKMVAFRVHENLRLVLQPPKRLRVRNAVAVALERRAIVVGRFSYLATFRLGC